MFYSIKRGGYVYMKRSLVFIVAAVMAFTLLAGCGGASKGQEPAGAAAAGYKDGTYSAEEEAFAENGWKYKVTIEVKDGKIVKADWNGVHKDGGKDKKTLSADGEYGMVANGGASAEWHEQAALVEAYLIEKQDPSAIAYTDDEGHTDAITGASIHVKEFFDLAAKALEKAK
jgi:major membrane immunogen (membrane-anchored lipoprotein)